MYDNFFEYVMLELDEMAMKKNIRLTKNELIYESFKFVITELNAYEASDIELQALGYGLTMCRDLDRLGYRPDDTTYPGVVLIHTDNYEFAMVTTFKNVRYTTSSMLRKLERNDCVYENMILQLAYNHYVKNRNMRLNFTTLDYCPDYLYREARKIWEIRLEKITTHNSFRDVPHKKREIPRKFWQEAYELGLINEEGERL